MHAPALATFTHTRIRFDIKMCAVWCDGPSLCIDKRVFQFYRGLTDMTKRVHKIHFFYEIQERTILCAFQQNGPRAFCFGVRLYKTFWCALVQVWNFISFCAPVVYCDFSLFEHATAVYILLYYDAMFIKTTHRHVFAFRNTSSDLLQFMGDTYTHVTCFSKYRKKRTNISNDN